jgi:GUN4-like
MRSIQMQKNYLFTLLLSILGTLYFSPTLAQSTQESNSTAVPPSEVVSPSPQPGEAVSPSSETSPTEGSDANGSTPTTTEEDNEVDYSQLEAALQQRNWEAADEETYQIMLKIAGSTSESQGMFDLTEWQNFSCDDLRKIDELWREASAGELGFSAQKRVFELVGRNSGRYYDQIGWRPLRGDWLVSWTLNEETKRVEYLPNRQPNFEDPPVGHLPAKLEWSNGADYRFEKVYSCNL